MPEVRTAENLDLGNHKPGYEWAAGSTPPNDAAPGKWMVEYDGVWWRALFRSAPSGVEYPIQAFSPDDEGERVAKVMANKLVDIAWEAYRNDPRRRLKNEEVVG